MDILLGIGTALWIGVLTSISPCPLATNIAAISFISKNVESSKSIFLTGLLYTLGRMLAYIVLTIIIIKSIISTPGLSFFLQTQMHKIIGPLLIIVGMFMLELISIPLPSIPEEGKLSKAFKNMGTLGAFPLGILFALSFCPVSAALYFGSLIPLTSNFSDSFLIPAMYGIETGLPVIFFSILLLFSTSLINKVFKGIGKFEYWFRMTTGVIFICVSIYLCLTYIFEIF